MPQAPKGACGTANFYKASEASKDADKQKEPLNKLITTTIQQKPNKSITHLQLFKYFEKLQKVSAFLNADTEEQKISMEI